MSKREPTPEIIDKARAVESGILAMSDEICELQARARIAQQREAEILEALCEARSLIDNFGYALAGRVSVGHAAGVRARMNEALAKIDRLVAERES